MIDTVVMTLRSWNFRIIDPDRFEPSARFILNGSKPLGARGYFTAYQNPTKEEFRKGIYKPRLTLINRYDFNLKKRETSLRIELSIPKLLFGNNFDEVTFSDLTRSVELLRTGLANMSVAVSEYSIYHAPISAIHYSKNIVLTDGTTTSYLSRKLKECNFKLPLDVNQADYRNEGHSYRWHCNSYEIVFYDKLKDLEIAKISEKRTIEKDYQLQLNLNKTVRKTSPFEIIRLEARLNKRQKIRQDLKKINFPVDLIYKNLFNPEISRKILLKYIDEMAARRYPIIDYHPPNIEAMLSDLIVRNPNLGIKKALQLIGLKQILDSVPFRALRTMFNSYSKRSWYRLVSDAKKVNLPSVMSPFKIIRDHINQFKPVKLLDFQPQMLNNDKYKLY